MPSAATSSPWGEGLQHGSPPTALLAHVLDERHPRADMRIARIAMDFLGPIPRREVQVRTRVLRPGRRIELLEGTLESGGREVVTARVWRIAVQPEGSVPPGVTPADAVPPLPPEQPQEYFSGLRDWGYGEALEWRFTDGAFGSLGRAAVWTRVRVPLIAGEPLRPLERLLLAADSANGISGELPMREWLFVPPSLSIALQRYPEGEWTFMDARTALGGDGLGVTTARYADQTGPLGIGTQALLIERRS